MDTQTPISMVEAQADLPPSGLLITLKDGLIGCEAWKRFLLDTVPEAAPLMLMRPLDEPEVSFIVVDPHTIAEDYRLRLSDADRLALGSPVSADLAAVVIINAGRHEGVTTPTANLLGPIAVNLATGAARQVIQPEYSAQHPIASS